MQIIPIQSDSLTTTTYRDLTHGSRAPDATGSYCHNTLDCLYLASKIHNTHTIKTDFFLFPVPHLPVQTTLPTQTKIKQARKKGINALTKIPTISVSVLMCQGPVSRTNSLTDFHTGISSAAISRRSRKDTRPATMQRRSTKVSSNQGSCRAPLKRNVR